MQNNFSKGGRGDGASEALLFIRISLPVLNADLGTKRVSQYLTMSDSVSPATAFIVTLLSSQVIKKNLKKDSFEVVKVA